MSCVILLVCPLLVPPRILLSHIRVYLLRIDHLFRFIAEDTVANHHHMTHIKWRVICLLRFQQLSLIFPLPFVKVCVAQGESSGLVCRLHKSLYGLKQSPRAWFEKFSSVVQQFGMSYSEVHHSVFSRHSSAGCIYLIVYVDDIVLTGSDNLGIFLLKQHLCCHFQTKDLGKLRYFLGIEVAQSNSGIIPEEICIGYFGGNWVNEF